MMDDQRFDIIFRGDILPGHTLLDVQNRLAQLFKTDLDKIRSLFSGAAVPLKKNVDEQSAERYKEALTRAGAQVQIAPAGAVGNRQRSVAKKPPQSSRPSMKERLEAQSGTAASEVEDNPFLTSDSGSPAPAPAAAQTDTPVEAPSSKEVNEQAASTEDTFTLAAVGADLLAPSERTSAEELEVDVSHFSLREASGNLVDSNEIERPEDAVVADVNYQLGDVGEDLLAESERQPIAEANIDVSGMDLAPVGSDLGQVTPHSEPVAPDTSALSLVPQPDEADS